MTRSPARRALRAAGVLAAVAFVALLAYGLTTQGHELDDRRRALARRGGRRARLLARRARRRPRRRRRRGAKAAADGEVSLTELRGTPLVRQLLGLLVRPVPRRGEGARARLEAAADGDVLFLGLDAQDAREDARDFIAQFGLTFPHVRDPGNDTQRAWGVTGLPETYFIAADGRVVGHVIGTVDDGAAARRDRRGEGRAGPPGADQGGDQRPVK